MLQSLSLERVSARRSVSGDVVLVVHHNGPLANDIVTTLRNAITDQCPRGNVQEAKRPGRGRNGERAKRPVTGCLCPFGVLSTTLLLGFLCCCAKWTFLYIFVYKVRFIYNSNLWSAIRTAVVIECRLIVLILWQQKNIVWSVKCDRQTAMLLLV